MPLVLIAYLYAGLVRHQTTMVVDLSQVKPFEEEKRWWKKSEKKQPVKIRFIIEAVIGVAEVSFHCRECAPKHDRGPASKLTCYRSRSTHGATHQQAS